MKAGFATLGEVAEFINGAAFKPSDWGDVGKKIIRIQNLTDSSKPYNKTTRSVNKKLTVNYGDILVSWSATLGVFVWAEKDEAVLNQHIFKVIHNSKIIDKNYLRHCLHKALDAMTKHLHGATMKHVNRGEFLATEIPLPPLAEQQRIAALLDTADRILKQRESAIAKLDQLAQSVFAEMFLNSDWSSKCLKQLGKVKTGGTPSSDKSGMFGADIPFITPGDLQSNLQPKRFLSLEGSTQSVVVKKGSALVCCIGATIGKMDKAKTDSAFNQQLNAVEWSNEINEDYGIYALRNIKNKIINGGTATTLPIIKKSLFEKLEIKVPPINLQNKFSQYISKIEEQKKVHGIQLHIAIAMTSSLQHQSFAVN